MALASQTAERFALYIEHCVHHRKMSYMDAVLDFCTKRNIEPELVVGLLNDKIKYAIGREASGLHLMVKPMELPFD